MFTAASTQLEMHCSETLDAAKAASTAFINAIVTTAVTTKKGAALEEFERMVSAAATQLTDSKNKIVSDANAELAEMTRSGTIGVVKS